MPRTRSTSCSASLRAAIQPFCATCQVRESGCQHVSPPCLRRMQAKTRQGTHLDQGSAGGSFQERFRHNRQPSPQLYPGHPYQNLRYGERRTTADSTIREPTTASSPVLSGAGARHSGRRCRTSMELAFAQIKHPGSRIPPTLVAIRNRLRYDGRYSAPSTASPHSSRRNRQANCLVFPCVETS